MNKGFVDSTLLKFALVGMINTVVGVGVMFSCYNLLGFDYWLSSALNYVFGSIVSYVLNKYFTFKNKHKSLMQIAKYVINILLCYFIAYGMAKPFVSYVMGSASVKLKDNLAMMVGMGLFTVLNYCGQRFIVFKE